MVVFKYILIFERCLIEDMLCLFYSILCLISGSMFPYRLWSPDCFLSTTALFSNLGVGTTHPKRAVSQFWGGCRELGAAILKSRPPVTWKLLGPLPNSASPLNGLTRCVGFCPVFKSFFVLHKFYISNNGDEDSSPMHAYLELVPSELSENFLCVGIYDCTIWNSQEYSPETTLWSVSTH